MKICIATLFNEDYKKIASITTPNMLEYARKHNYDFVCSMQKYDDRPTSWHKIPFIFNLFNMYDWILWLDTDVLFVDFSYKLEQFIDQDYDSIIGWSHQIEPGVWFIKSSETMRELFTLTYQQDKFIHDGGWEQTGLKAVLSQRKDLDERIKKISMDPINLDPNFINPPTIHPLARAPGIIKYKESEKPFIIHAGWGQEGNDRKYSILKHYLDKVKNS